MQQGQEKEKSQAEQVNNHNPELNTQNEFYNENLHQSKAHSVVSHTSNPQNLLKFFQQYQTAGDLNMAELHGSPNLKLKKYKQSIYYGQFVHGKRNGRGIMIYDNKRVYEGDWVNQIKSGLGYEKFPNECTYKGEYASGKPQGVGRYTWPNGQFYQGQWVCGMKQGSGMWRGAKGDSYIGQWKMGKADGYGVHTWVNGDRYQGQFHQCLKHGQGIQKFANGDIYKGLYEAGKPSGFGEYYWANGSYFKGIFHNGLRDGQGIWKRGPGNSDKYEGQYSQDKKSGYGIFTWSSGNIYKGNYESDSRNGYGQMYWSDGSFYKGQWKNGIQHGEGQIYVPGQGYKKGVFEENVLIIVERQSNSTNYISHETVNNNRTVTMGKNVQKKSVVVPSKVNFRSRNNQKLKARQAKSIDESSVVRYDQGKNMNSHGPHPLLPKKFTRTRENNNSITSKQSQNKNNRVLHSSFYMHKLHNRGSTSVQGSRAQSQSRHSEAQSQQNKRRNLLAEMKNFARKKGGQPINNV